MSRARRLVYSGRPSEKLPRRKGKAPRRSVGRMRVPRVGRRHACARVCVPTRANLWAGPTSNFPGQGCGGAAWEVYLTSSQNFIIQTHLLCVSIARVADRHWHFSFPSVGFSTRLHGQSWELVATIWAERQASLRARVSGTRGKTSLRSREDRVAVDSY